MYPLNRWNPAKAFFASSFFISVSLTAIIFIFLVVESFPVFLHNGIGFLSGSDWYPPGESYGALSMIYGTAVVTSIAICVAFPMALGSAVITSEVLNGRIRLIVKMMMELLAGIPGVVYGLLGIALLTTFVKKTFNLIDGNSFFTAGILLGIMILPTIMTLSEDALRSVPKEYRDQSLALGLNRTETILYAVLPKAVKGITGAVLLGLGRAMGETISVMLVIGSLDKIPRPFYNIFTTGQTITSKLGREGAEALGVGYHWSALSGLGLILFLTVIGIAFIGNIIVRTPAKEKVFNRVER